MSNQVHSIHSDACIRESKEKPSSALASPLRDIQFFARRREVGVYHLNETWFAYIGFVCKDLDQKQQYLLGFAKVVVPDGSVVVISKDPSRVRGITYRMRTPSVIIQSVHIQSAPFSEKYKSHREVISQHPNIEFIGGVHEQILKFGGGVINGPYTNMLQSGSFCRNPTVIDGDGLVVEPTLRECLRVGQHIIQQDTNEDNSSSEDGEICDDSSSCDDDTDHVEETEDEDGSDYGAEDVEAMMSASNLQSSDENASDAGGGEMKMPISNDQPALIPGSLPPTPPASPQKIVPIS
jgi:hypothetical protein